jgi:hypothetical protein
MTIPEAKESRKSTREIVAVHRERKTVLARMDTIEWRLR